MVNHGYFKCHSSLLVRNGFGKMFKHCDLLLNYPLPMPRTTLHKTRILPMALVPYVALLANTTQRIWGEQLLMAMLTTPENI